MANKDEKLDTNVIENSLELPKKLIKSKKRVKEFGEVFTPDFIVKQMCDLCEPHISQIDKKIFEPTCGNGNFLVEILERKLNKIPKNLSKEKLEFYIIWALSNIYAVDIQLDNVEEARKRLENMVLEFVKNKKSSIYFLNSINLILKKNIIVGDTLKQKKKLHFFDFKADVNNLSFDIQRYSLQEIEENNQKSKTATLINLKEKILEIESPPPKPKTKKTAKKPKKSKNSQLSLI